MKDLLENVKSTRTLLLTQYSYKSMFGDRSFSRIGPKIWNLLPMQLRIEKDTQKFKKMLKTFLFDESELIFTKAQ